MMRCGFADIQWTLEETIIEEDKIAARYIKRGTHQGVFFGLLVFIHIAEQFINSKGTK